MRLGVALVVVASVALVARDAAANGRFPAASQLVTSPRDPLRMAVRTTYGFLVSADGGITWEWICERAIGYGGIEDPTFAIAGNGTLLAGMFSGLGTSADQGCSWRREPKMPEVVVDLTQRTSSPDALYAISSQYKASRGDAGTVFRSELFVTTDNGTQWSRRAVFDPTLRLETVDAAPSDPRRVYLSGTRTVLGKEPQGTLLTSDDDGGHFVEHPMALLSGERAPYVAGVDPRDSQRVYVRMSGIEASRLLVSDDGGVSFRVIFAATSILGFALSPDGEKIYVGGLREGLQVASRPAYRFEKRWPLPVSCLAVRGQTLWACSLPSSGFVVGVSTDDGATFEPRLRLTGMRGTVICDGGAATICAGEYSRFWIDHPREPPYTPIASASASRASPPDAAAEPAPTPSQKGCVASPCTCASICDGALDARALALFVLCLGVARLRRRRKTGLLLT